MQKAAFSVSDPMTMRNILLAHASNIRSMFIHLICFRNVYLNFFGGGGGVMLWNMNWMPLTLQSNYNTFNLIFKKQKKLFTTLHHIYPQVSKYKKIQNGVMPWADLSAISFSA